MQEGIEARQGYHNFSVEGVSLRKNDPHESHEDTRTGAELQSILWGKRGSGQPGGLDCTTFFMSGENGRLVKGSRNNRDLMLVPVRPKHG
jgi:hypothetical protein